MKEHFKSFSCSGNPCVGVLNVGVLNVGEVKRLPLFQDKKHVHKAWSYNWESFPLYLPR